MSGWKRTLLGELISIRGGFSYQGKYIGSGKSFLLGMGCVSYSDKFLLSGARAYAGDCPRSYLVNPGDIVLATRQQSDNLPILGLPALIPKDLGGKNVIAGANLYVVKNDSEVDNKFLYWLLKTPNYRNHISACSKGTTVRMITKDAVESFEFDCPAKVERENISNTLWSIENKIDLLHLQNKTIESLAETLFRQWFVEEAKQDWEIIKIADVAEINSRTITKKYPFNEIEYLDTGSITNGTIEEFKPCALNNAPSRAQRIIVDNDIVYSLVRPIQRHYGLLNGLKPNAIASTGFCVISCRDFSPHFLYLLLTRTENVEYFDMIAEGSTSTYPSLKPSDIANFEFQKPPNEKLIEFTKLVSVSWEKINSNRAQIQTLTQLRDDLLPKLMSGEVRVEI